MATKKVGPPVPPRPSAVSVLAKSRSASPTVQNHNNNNKSAARIVVYKSPSLENTRASPPKISPPTPPIIAEKPSVNNEIKSQATMNENAKPPVSVRVVTPPVPKPRHKSPARAAAPLQAIRTSSIEIDDSQALAFQTKFLNEVAERNKNITLPSRPDPEGKEKDLKIIDEKSNNNKIFSEMLISELTSLHSIENLNLNNKNEDDPEIHSPKVNKNAKNNSNNNNNKNRPESISSNDTSPNGTKSRIRTSDWIEVGDNGKEVIMTSCHISLEDSGLEDEEKLDDASSGVGDSWDSVRDTEER